ncbi:MAG TPA: CDGSH iron-sulfur domain-containing protein [Hyphomicrobiaceae bacterium]|nr:CDGSH iron-sulfur domain-containing protein [Hyphomicrobiaceae bacterium]
MKCSGAVDPVSDQGDNPGSRFKRHGKRQGASGKSLPVSPQIGPFVVEVKEGVHYRWCSCGLSKSQPWCDGTHVGTQFAPIEFEAPVSGKFYMCGCKRSDNKPFCFGNCRGIQRSSRS